MTLGEIIIGRGVRPPIQTRRRGDAEEDAEKKRSFVAQGFGEVELGGSFTWFGARRGVRCQFIAR